MSEIHGIALGLNLKSLFKDGFFAALSTRLGTFDFEGKRKRVYGKVLRNSTFNVSFSVALSGVLRINSYQSPESGCICTTSLIVLKIVQ